MSLLSPSLNLEIFFSGSSLSNEKQETADERIGVTVDESRKKLQLL